MAYQRELRERIATFLNERIEGCDEEDISAFFEFIRGECLASWRNGVEAGQRKGGRGGGGSRARSYKGSALQAGKLKKREQGGGDEELVVEFEG